MLYGLHFDSFHKDLIFGSQAIILRVNVKATMTKRDICRAKE